MANGIIVDGISWPNTLPLSQADKLLPSVGGVFLFDFGKQLSTAPLAGASIPNLVRGGPSASVNATGLILAGGGLDFSATTDSQPRLSLGNYTLTTRSVFLLAWVRLPTVGVANAGIVGAAINTSTGGTDNQLVMYTGGTGLQVVGQAYDNTNSLISYTHRTVDSPGLLYQAAMEYNIGTGQKVTYLNGVQVGSVALPAGAAGLRATTKPWAVGSWNGNAALGKFTGRIYRTYLEDLTASGRTGASIVAADWAANNGRFT